MPMSAPGTSEAGFTAFPVASPAQPKRGVRVSLSWGFSLIELMIVLVIIGIASSMLSISAFPGRHQDLRQEAQRLVELFKLAQIEARSDGRRIDWQFDKDGYRFMRLRRSAQPTPESVRHQVMLPDFFEHDSLLRPRRWQAPLVRIEGSALSFTAEWLLPPALLVLHTDEAQLTIVRDAAGQYEIH